MVATPGESGGLGRPSDYSPEVVDVILEALYQGKTLREVMRSNPDLPDRRTIYRWMDAHEDFRHQYVRAREAAMDARVEEMREIADNDSGDVQRDKLRLDQRKWEACKLYPRLYGDKQTTEIHGKDGGPIETTSPQDSLRWILFAMAAHKEDK